LIADVALFAEGLVLLVRYRDVAKYDNESGWFLPDDELKYLEHPERAATRILKEQLGLAGLKPRLDHIESFKGNSGTWHMSFHSKLDLARMPRLKPSNGLAGGEVVRTWEVAGPKRGRSSWLGASRPRGDGEEPVLIIGSAFRGAESAKGIAVSEGF